MQYDLTDNITSKSTKGSAIFGVFSDKNINTLSKSVSASDLKAIKGIINNSSFEGKINQNLCIYESSNQRIEKIYLVGLGDKDKYNEKKFLKSVISSCELFKKENLKNIYFCIDSFISSDISLNWAVRNISIHINGIDYEYNDTKNKTKNKNPYKISKFIFKFNSIRKNYKENIKKYFAQGAAIANGIKLAKNLGDLPSNICTPTYLANTAKKLGKSNKKLNIKIHNEKEMKSMGMNCLLSVGNGSEEPSKLITIKYNGAGKNQKPIAL